MITKKGKLLMNNAYKDIVSKYIYAKDNNKPHLMKSVFTEVSKLDVKLKSQNISFPATTKGLKEITEVLISSFNNTYDNVYTLCLEDTLVLEENSLKSIWLVVMTEKQSGKVRFGYGSYYWSFHNNNLAEYLNITIENMIILEEKFADELLTWISSLAYPWCESRIILESLPKIEELDSFRKEF